MIEDESLHIIFDDEIFLVADEKDKGAADAENKSDISETEVADKYQLSEQKNDPVNQEDDQNIEIISRNQKVPAGPETNKRSAANSDQEKSEQLFIATEVLNDAGNELVSKITSAVGLTKDDYKVSIGSSAGIPAHKRAIIFTKNPKMPLYEVSNFRGTQLLVSKSLEELEQSRDEKVKLWTALKKWYGV